MGVTARRRFLRTWRIAGLLSAGASVAACGREVPKHADSAMAPGAVRPAVTIGMSGPPACPATGHWSSCSVVKRLESAGVAPQTTKSLPDLPALGATPTLFKVGSSGLAIYLFADSIERARATRSLDTNQYVSAAKELTMRGEATSIQNDNLLALLFSRSEQQRERVSDALTAGPPQPRQP